MNRIEEMKTLVANSEWESLIKLANLLIANRANTDVAQFFLSLALRKSGRAVDALSAAAAGLALSPKSQWGAMIYFEAAKANDQVKLGVEFLQKFLDENPSCDQVRHLLVDQAADIGEFEIATSYWQDGLSSDQAIGISDISVAIQCFAKPDTLERSIKSLLSCNGRSKWNIVIYQDSINGSNNKEKYAYSHEETFQVIQRYINELSQEFRSVSVIKQTKNLGTTLGCRFLLDYAFSIGNYAVLLEDDCEFTSEALNWFSYIRSHLGSHVWFAAGETIFFNPGAREITPDQAAKLITLADELDLHSKFTEIDFVPSSCFATTKEIWAKTRLVRSLPRGDENLSAFLRMSGGRTIMPIMPLVADRGMQHDLGYSVVTLGKSNVREIKNHVPMNIKFDPTSVGRFSGNLGLLHRATCGMEIEAYKLLIDSGSEIDAC